MEDEHRQTINVPRQCSAIMIMVIIITIFQAIGLPMPKYMCLEVLIEGLQNSYSYAGMSYDDKAGFTRKLHIFLL